MAANVSVSNTTGLYIGSGATSILNSAQQLLTILDNNGNVNFALDSVTSNTTVKAYFIGNTSVYSNANVAAFLPTYSGTLSPSAIYTNGYFYANGQPFVGTAGSSYGNANVAVYLASNTDPTISNLNANAAVQAVQINSITANVGTINANLGAFETYANVQFGTINANLGAFETYANATFATASSVQTLNANLGAYQIYANANAASQATSINTINANLGAFETYANLYIGANAYGNVQVAQFLPTYSGNLTALNLVLAGNLTVNGTTTSINYNEYVAGQLVANATTPSISTTTGALIVDGGAGIAGNVWAGNIITANGVFWANGTAYLTGSYGNTQVAAYMPIYTGSLGGTITNPSGNLAYGANLTISANNNSSSDLLQIFGSYQGNIQIQNSKWIKLASTSYGGVDFSTTPLVSIPQGNVNIAYTPYTPFTGGWLTVSNTATVGNLITTSGVFWANGTAYSTGISTYGNTQVTALLSTYNIPVQGTSLSTNGAVVADSVGAQSSSNTVFGAGTPSGALSAQAGGLGVAKDAYIKGTANVGNLQSSGTVTTTSGIFWANGTNYSTTVPGTYGNTQVGQYLTSGATAITANLGNVISTSGYFWANGTAYSTGSSFTGNLAGSTLYDSVNQRVFANAFPLSTPSNSVNGNNFSNFLLNAPIYTSGVLQAPISPTAAQSFSSLVFGMAQTGNVALQASGQTTNNRNTTNALFYSQFLPTGSNTFALQDRVRGVVVNADIVMNSKTWGTPTSSAQGSTTTVGINGGTTLLGNGTVAASMGVNSLVQIIPSANSQANVQYASGSFSQVALINTNGTTAQANVAYARLIAGSITGFSANLTVQNAVGLHTYSGWAGTSIGTGSTTGAFKSYALLNEDASTVIQTNGNVTVTGNLIMRGYQETVVSGTGGGALFFNVSGGTIQQFTLTSSISSITFTNLPPGGSVTLILIQGGSGGYTLTTTGIKYAGGSSTLSTAVGAIDMLNVLYDGTNYYGSLVKGYV